MWLQNNDTHKTKLDTLQIIIVRYTGLAFVQESKFILVSSRSSAGALMGTL